MKLSDLVTFGLFGISAVHTSTISGVSTKRSQSATSSSYPSSPRTLMTTAVSSSPITPKNACKSVNISSAGDPSISIVSSSTSRSISSSNSASSSVFTISKSTSRSVSSSSSFGSSISTTRNSPSRSASSSKVFSSSVSTVSNISSRSASSSKSISSASSIISSVVSRSISISNSTSSSKSTISNNASRSAGISSSNNASRSVSISNSTSSSSTSAPSQTAPPCPAIWTIIAADLRADFANCSQKAANAIRFAFHDAAGFSSKTMPYGPASGGADGSLLLNATEGARQEHTPMQGFRRYLAGKYQIYQPQGAGAADFVQFVSSLGIASCARRQLVPTVVGRIDDDTAAPAGLIPAAFGVNATHDVLVQLFDDKGIDERELAALMGAHSVSHAFVQSPNGIPANGAQDSTPELLDTLYYPETQAEVAPDNVYRFDSDIHLAAANTTSGQAFTEFGNDASSWMTAFSAAMYKLSTLGLPQSQIDLLVDCSDPINVILSS